MSSEQYATFRHEALLLLGKRHRAALLGDGKGLLTLGLLYTGLRSGVDGLALLPPLDKLALLWVRQEQACVRPEGYVPLPNGVDAEYDALREDFVALVVRYKPLDWRCAAPGLMTALYMLICLRYETLLLPLFEDAALALVARTSFRSTGAWQLWLYRGMACAYCYATAELVLCGRCRCVYYCSVKCRDTHHECHKAQCIFDL